ncbi:MAG: GNAT family N-acetyltransferase [Ilumatobacteraceae bacterium]
MATKVEHNEAGSRYELRVDDRIVGIADYHRIDDVLDFTHTEVVPSHAGRGLGTVLAVAALDDVKRQSLSVIPHCWFMRDVIAEHPDQYLALVPVDRRAQFRLPVE